ncbi:MAG: response regulator [Thermodesulfobacteriota bacterium]
MKTVLIVDDTKLVRHVLAKKLEPYTSEFNVLTAENGREAVDHIQAVKVDLVVTDLQMPVMDGFELLAHLSNSHPEIPVFVMTANGSPEVEQRIDAMGSSIKYFEKPIDVESLLSAMRGIFNAGAQGAVNGISLASFLQLIQMENKSCTLRVKSGGRSGQLFCQEGQLIAAETDSLAAEKAAIEMISWDSTVIEILPFNRQKPKEIKQPLMNILMEGSRRKDEMTAAQKAAKKEPPKPRPAQPPEPPKKKPDKGDDAGDIASMYQWD